MDIVSDKLCACGCGQHTLISKSRARHLRGTANKFLKGHFVPKHDMPHSAETKAKLAEYTGERAASYKHGWSHTPTWKSWKSMHERCEDPRNASYKYYGARGITVCERWTDFEPFLEDMGERPEGDYSIDRIDAKGNYEPANCRWLTRAEQNARRADPGGWIARRARMAREALEREQGS